MKERIAPHGNEDYVKNELHKDLSMCSTTRLPILESVASLYELKAFKADATAAVF